MFEPFVPAFLIQPPIATLIIAGLAMFVNLASSLVRKRFTDIEKTKRIQKEVREFNTDLRKAMMSKDKEKETKLKKKQKKMNEMQMKMMTQNLKTSMYFMLPFFGVWWILIGAFGYETIMAYSPIAVPLLTPPPSLGISYSVELNFFWWYFLSSISFNGIISKITGTGMTD
ncbi:MAG: EMC3/TMCO1 family protein [Nitrososphaerales archaeon]|nr:EMC3/TMCO1 family protein [Nitrososphaerales archaeon]